MPNQIEEKLQKKNKLTKKFERFADKINEVIGSPYWFFFSLILVLIWIPSGFLLGWGEIWHLLINTTTTILTFLMMSLLHSSQSKWEDRMERMQQREDTKIREIGKATKTIILEKENSKKDPEEVDSLF